MFSTPPTRCRVVRHRDQELTCQITGADSGRPPVILVHGSLADYRYWDRHLEFFAQRYTVVTFSRRYSYPNENRELAWDYSARSDAEDLRGVLTELALGPAHLIGHSYGGFAALVLAGSHPELLRSMVLSEPPALGSLLDTAAGRLAYNEHLIGLWEGIKAAFTAGRPADVLRMTIDYFSGDGQFDRMPEPVRQVMRGNIREWEALAFSSDPFPRLPESIRELRIPTLFLVGERTRPMFKKVVEELAEAVPNSQVHAIPDAGHEMWESQPALCRRAALGFLRRYPT